MGSTRASQQRRGFRLHEGVLRRITSVRATSAVARPHARDRGREGREVGRDDRVLGDVGRPWVSRVGRHGGGWARRESLRRVRLPVV